MWRCLPRRGRCLAYGFPGRGVGRIVEKDAAARRPAMVVLAHTYYPTAGGIAASLG
jgi:hypothetical protein